MNDVLPRTQGRVEDDDLSLVLQRPRSLDTRMRNPFALIEAVKLLVFPLQQ